MGFSYVIWTNKDSMQSRITKLYLKMHDEGMCIYRENQPKEQSTTGKKKNLNVHKKNTCNRISVKPIILQINWQYNSTQQKPYGNASDFLLQGTQD